MVAKDVIVRRAHVAMGVVPQRPHAYFVHWDAFDLVTSIDLEPVNHGIYPLTNNRWCLQQEYLDMMRRFTMQYGAAPFSPKAEENENEEDREEENATRNAKRQKR